MWNDPRLQCIDVATTLLGDSKTETNTEFKVKFVIDGEKARLFNHVLINHHSYNEKKIVFNEC